MLPSLRRADVWCVIYAAFVVVGASDIRTGLIHGSGPWLFDVPLGMFLMGWYGYRMWRRGVARR